MFRVLLVVTALLSGLAHADRVTLSHTFDHPIITNIDGYYEYDTSIVINATTDPSRCSLYYPNAHMKRVYLQLTYANGDTRVMDSENDKFSISSAFINDRGELTEYFSLLNVRLSEQVSISLGSFVDRYDVSNCATLSPTDTLSNVRATLSVTDDGNETTTVSTSPVFIVLESTTLEF